MRLRVQLEQEEHAVPFLEGPRSITALQEAPILGEQLVDAPEVPPLEELEVHMVLLLQEPEGRVLEGPSRSPRLMITMLKPTFLIPPLRRRGLHDHEGLG